MGFTFGFDIGVSSVGWAVVNHEQEILEAGSNIFEQKYAGENENRREYRQRRRLLRRQKTRLGDFHRFWVKNTDNDPEGVLNNPLELRNRGLIEELTVVEVYTVLHNMLKHRGISYLEDALDENTSGQSDYVKGLQVNQAEMKEKLPCQIQQERLKAYGSYRGNTIVDMNGERMILSNVFTISSYRKELKRFFEIQSKYHDFITDKFIEEYFEIFNRKRKYYEGPGNEKSRTDYGIYSTQIDPETGNFITERNIFDKLIGKCSVFPDEFRASSASWTAQEFNALNDLNNLKVNGRKLTQEEKLNIIEGYLASNVVNVRKIIKTAIGEDIESLTGARIDKSEKELFHNFETYRKMKKEFVKASLDLDKFSKDDLDKIGHILTINTDRESIITGFDEYEMVITEQELDCFVDFRKRNGSLFNKWHSFSIKIMKELIPQMYEEPKEQMTLLVENGYIKSNMDMFREARNIPADVVTEEIYNPVVSRSVAITVRIANALIKKYGYPDEIVIEMPRDKNDEERKKRLKDFQRSREKELKDILAKIKKEYGIKIEDKHFRNHDQLRLKLKLWDEQRGKCLYSGKPIEIQELLDDKNLFEIDHVIPRSISFDDSRTNKVLVYAGENQKKGNKTPYYYLKNNNKDWSFEEYKAYVLSLNINRKKKDNLLFMDDITSIDVLKGFIARNLNDTRYASKVVLNTLQKYFIAKGLNTKVKVVRGSFTNDMRKTLKLEKNREESYSHHAVDAMLICLSQMGYEAYRKLQTEAFDWETGEILDQEKFEKIFSDTFYENEMYTYKWWDISQKIKEAEKNVKFWHKVDRKFNRALCNQTIRGTRTFEDKVYKINKTADIRTKEGYALFKKKVKDGKSEEFLMALHDPRTFESLVQIMNDYSDAENPFVAYEAECGDYIRKYAKNGKGPRIETLKYKDGQVNSCIDISEKYGHEEGSKKVILESLKPYRMDVYYNKEEELYYLVGIKYSDCKFDNGNYIIDEKAYNEILVHEKMISPDETYRDLETKGINFVMSFYENDIIRYEKNGEYFTERFLSRTMPNKKNYIETKPITKSKFDKQNLVGLGKTKNIVKIRTDILGDQYICKKEKFVLTIDKQ